MARYFAGLPVMANDFTVHLRQSGISFEVGPRESILTAMSRAGVYHPYACAAGICGACEATVVSGEPDHRDYILTDSQRDEGKRIVLCVSRSLSEVLELDL